MISFLFLIGTILVRNVNSKNNNSNSSNNCSQTIFDEASLNYMSFFNFHSRLIDNSCPSVKAIAFKKNDLLEVEMKIQILKEIWNILSDLEKTYLIAELKSRIHFSCNSETIPTELCRTDHALDGGIYISTYDGSLMKHQFQKSCSVCLLKLKDSRTSVITQSNISNSIIANLNLSVSDVVNFYDSTDNEIMSVKFIRSPDKTNLESKYLLKSIFGKIILDQSLSISASLFYNIKVKLNSKSFHRKQDKSLQNNVNSCIFRCDWSSICLKNMSLICNDKVDCQYGDDENVFICQIFHKSNSNNLDYFKNKNNVNSKVLGKDFSHNKENMPIILSVILLSVALICVGIIILVCFNIRNRNLNSSKKQSRQDFPQFSHEDPSFSCRNLHKLHLKDKNGPLIKDNLLIESQSNKDVHSIKCNSSIHNKTKNLQKNKFINPIYLKQNEIVNQQKWEGNTANKPSDLCSQVNYPDPVTKSSWLRSYFQMTKIRNQMYVKAPIVVNISKFSPVFFSCNN